MKTRPQETPGTEDLTLNEACNQTVKDIEKESEETEMQDEQSAFIQLSAKAAQDFAILIYQLQETTGDLAGFGELNLNFPLKSGQVLTMKCEVSKGEAKALKVVE